MKNSLYILLFLMVAVVIALVVWLGPGINWAFRTYGQISNPEIVKVG